jgi:hypothetical protein
VSASLLGAPRGRLAWLVVALLALASLGADPGLASENGIVEGLVTNGSQGGSPVEGSPVVLNALDESDRLERRESTIGADGRYRFEGLPTAAGLRYLPVVEFQGAAYFPQPVSLEQEPRQQADITVYEATESDQWVAFERTNLLVRAVGPNRLELMEMGALANVGDRTFVGSEATAGSGRVTLRFDLPAGAVDVAPQAGFAPNDFQAGPDGVTIGGPIVPGRHQLALSYGLPFQGSSFTLTKRLTYPALGFNLYLPDVGVQLESPQLTARGPAELGGQRYLLYSAQQLPRGTELQVRLSGLPVAARSLTEQLLWPLGGLGGLALTAALLLGYRRAVARGTDQPLAAASQEAAEVERVRLLLSIARLDRRFEQGEVSREQYERERERSKERLLAIGAGREAGTAD